MYSFVCFGRRFAHHWASQKRKKTRLRFGPRHGDVILMRARIFLHDAGPVRTLCVRRTFLNAFGPSHCRVLSRILSPHHTQSVLLTLSLIFCSFVADQLHLRCRLPTQDGFNNTITTSQYNTCTLCQILRHEWRDFSQGRRIRCRRFSKA